MEFIKFNSPIYLIIAASAVFAVWLLQMRNAQRKPILRLVVICLILIGLSEPMLLIRTNDQCVLFVVDVSKSINENEKAAIKDYIALKIKEKRDDDRIGVLQFGEKAALVVPPSGLTRGELLSKLSLWSESREIEPEFTDLENALLTASKLFPEGFSKRLVLITDGNENTGDVSSLFDELRAMGITVDVLPAGGINHDEALVEALYAPAEVRVGNPFSLEVSVSSNIETDGNIKIAVDGEDKILIDDLTIIPGNHRHKFPVALDKGGFHEISVRLAAKKDGIFINNSAETFVYTASRPRILIVTDPSSDNTSRKYLGNVLTKNNLDTVYMHAGIMPSDPKEYISYDAVVLDDIPSLLLSSEQMKALSNAVHDIGTGLVLIGGDTSIGSKGFANTPIESAMPVSLIPSHGERPSSLDLVFVMDKSGSMSEGGDESKIRLAADAAQSIIDMSGEEDNVGIIAFDSESHVISSPGSIKNRDEIIKKIQSVMPRGSTDLFPAMTQAFDWLKKSEASHKHVILLSDGRTRERDFSQLIEEMRKRDITISAVAVGRESNITLMKDIALMGGGRFFQVEDDLHELSKIFQIDAMTASRSLVVEDSFLPRLKEPDAILNGMPLNMPVMHGYMVTSPKKTSVIPVISHLGDPVVGFWNYGIGRSVIFTGDDGLQWSRDWLRWKGFGRLLVQMVKRSLRSGANGETLQVFHVKGSRVEIQHEASENNKDITMKITAKILSPDGKSIDTKLLRSSDGSYTGTLGSLSPGKYLAVIAEESHGNFINLSKGNFIISDKEEFLTLDRNDKLIEDITSHSGGRILTDKDPLLNDAEKKTERFIPIWPYFFILAVILFLADIAIQRKLLNHYLK